MSLVDLEAAVVLVLNFYLAKEFLVYLSNLHTLLAETRLAHPSDSDPLAIDQDNLRKDHSHAYKYNYLIISSWAHDTRKSLE